MKLNCIRRLIGLAAVLLAALGTGVVAIAQPRPLRLAAKLLVFRNIPRGVANPDFEDALRTLKIPFEVKSSAEMKTARMADYRVIVIPGAQWETSFTATLPVPPKPSIATCRREECYCWS